MPSENKHCCIIYHKNIYKLYKERWIKKCLESIYYQTYQGFDVYELNYGEKEVNIWNTKEDLAKFPEVISLYEQGRWFYIHEPMQNHVFAMNALINKVFSFNYYTILNINIDDYYSLGRFEKQLQYIKDYDIISSDLEYIEEGPDGEDKLCNGQPIVLSQTNIEERLKADWNVIAHPCVLMSREFWLNWGPYDVKAIPREDLNLWKKACADGARFKVIDKVLLHYRIHDKQICAKSR